MGTVGEQRDRRERERERESGTSAFGSRFQMTGKDIED
jgi:hypothetical protein